MPEIENYDVYNDRMRRSMWDKAFFMDKIPGAELIVDYGCADGSLIRFLHELFPAMRFIGFDIDPAMTAAANAQRSENTWFVSSMDDVVRTIRSLGIDSSRIAINFSSVLHEVFHYGFDLDALRGFIRAVSPRYLVVRDMMYVSDDDAAMVSEAAVSRVREALPDWQIRDFESCFGSISIRKNLMHLLLKYKYTENWARECRENYFSYNMEDMTAALNPYGEFEPILLSRCILPWCRCDMENTFSIDPGSELTTHFSAILARRSGEARISLDTDHER